MWIIELILISISISQISSAPGCLELCNQLGSGSGGSLNIQKSESESSSVHETYSSNFKQHQEDTLKDLHQSLTNHLANELHSSRLSIDNNRPGNWTEHKDYKTSDGAGQVHEEQGQLVNGQSQVRYYKKNYSSSYSSGQTGDKQSRLSTDLNSRFTNDQITDSSHLHSSHLSSDLNSQSDYRQNSFDNQRVVKTKGQPARLEDFGEQIETNHHHRTVNVDENPNNWRRHNSYNTDDGRGRVYEEEGQYHQGPVKVRYYKKNYTSSYSSGSIPADALQDLELHNQLFQSRLDKSSSANHGLYDRDGSNPRSRVREDYRNGEYHRMRAQEGYTPTVKSSSYNPHSQIYSSETHQRIQEQNYVPVSQVVTETRYKESQQHQNNENIAHIPLKQSEYILYDGGYDRHHQQLSNPLPVEQSGILMGDNLHQIRHNQFNERYINQPVGGRRVEEQHWSTSEHTSHTYPQQTSINNAQQLQNYNHEDQQNSNQYVSGGSYHRSYESHSGSTHGHRTADCDPPDHELRYNRRYRRGISQSTQQTEDLHQQYEDLQNDFSQQTEDLNQDFSQQTQNLQKELTGFDQQTANSGRGDQQSLDYLRNQRTREQTSHYGGDFNSQTQTTGYTQQQQQQQQQQHQYNQGSYYRTSDLNQQSQYGLDYSQQKQTNSYDFGSQHQQTRGLNRHLASSNYDQQQNVRGINSQVSQSHIYRGQNQQGDNLNKQTEHLNHLYTQQQTNNYNVDQQQSQVHQIQQTAELGQQTENVNQRGFDDYTQQQQSNNYNLGQQYVQRPGNQYQYAQQTQNNRNFGSYASETEDLNQQSTLLHGFQQDQGIHQQSAHSNVEQTEDVGFGSVNQLKPAPKPMRRFPQQSTDQLENAPGVGVLSLEDQNQQQQSGVDWHKNHQLSDLTRENFQEKSNYPGVNSEIRTSTFPTMLNGNRDTWEAHGYNPDDVISANHAFNLNTIPETTSGYDQYDTTPQPGFWKKVGKKIADTYEKAKEKITHAIKG